MPPWEFRLLAEIPAGAIKGAVSHKIRRDRVRETFMIYDIIFVNSFINMKGCSSNNINRNLIQ